MNGSILNFLFPAFFLLAASFFVGIIICLWRDVAYYSDLSDELKEELGYREEKE